MKRAVCFYFPETLAIGNNALNVHFRFGNRVLNVHFLYFRSAEFQSAATGIDI